MYTYSDFRWGFIRGIMLGINLGITLERHPAHGAKPLLTGPTGGSDGVPDSLGHKPVDTWGRGWMGSVAGAAGRSLVIASSPALVPTFLICWFYSLFGHFHC